VSDTGGAFPVVRSAPGTNATCRRALAMSGCWGQADL